MKEIKTKSFNKMFKFLILLLLKNERNILASNDWTVDRGHTIGGFVSSTMSMIEVHFYAYILIL